MELQEDYSDVVETLSAMFGNIISKEVILAVVESCGGDLNVAVDAVMSISSDIDIKKESDNQTETKHDTTLESAATNRPQPSTSISHSLVYIPAAQTSISYAGASRSTGAVPKQCPKPRPPPTTSMIWTDQLRQIAIYHNQGSRILIFMRGVPGSGKSYLAKQIVEMMIGSTYANQKTHICSTDDYFMVRGHYQYQRQRLSEAHEWNQNRVRYALKQGLSPILIDNTNIEIWEMEPYLKEGVRNGYIIEVVEPNTPWAKNANQLLRKNTHNVPTTTIRRMLDNYQDGITGEYLIKYYGLSYPADKVPPVLRAMPEYIPSQIILQPRPFTVAPTNVVEDQPAEIKPDTVNTESTASSTTYDLKESTNSEIPIEDESEEEKSAKNKRYLEIQIQLEEMEKVEKEWELGESWGDESQKNVCSGKDVPVVLEPRPQRRTDSEGSCQSSPRENLMQTVKKCDDWRNISLFMPSWTDESSPKVDECALPVVETKSTGTCVEVGDTNIENPKKVLKVISTTPRDINIFNIISSEKERIPAVRMLHKSTLTNDLSITETLKCKNEEQHFVAFRKLFKNIPRASLRDIFDQCLGDVNWAVDIVLGGMAENQLQIVEGGDLSDTEEETVKLEQCNCLAAYQIIPDAEPVPTTSNASQQQIPSVPTETILVPQKKAKITPSDSMLKLKRVIENNIVLSDDHYSQHALKIRKWRRGENYDQLFTQAGEDVLSTDSEQPSTSREILKEDSHGLQIKDEAAGLSDDEESNTSSLDEVERTINVNVGFEFIAQLDELFGRRGMAYPENIIPRINIPLSLLNEINAFWMESLMCQLDEHDKQNAKMIREDAEFARQLEMKEAELAKQGKEPEVPDFKEIMDMDFAISLYQKDVAGGWKSKEPKDMAAKLSRDKLYNLFPDMSPDVLSELLMAHDNNFQATVEVLLMSTGNTDILKEKNGLSKFVMQKEMERKEKLLAEEKMAMSKVEWPLLPKGEKVDLAVVENYRAEAEQHLLRRNLNYQKAQDYIRRGMTQVANYYSDIATFHKQKYEQANSLAAASLMQIHASNNPDNTTIDLHYLRVGEAKETVDLFLDTHIQNLKENTQKGMRSQQLFFITGYGVHSRGTPRIKPATRRRLIERGLTVSQRNPGLLTARVCSEDKLSYQIKTP